MTARANGTNELVCCATRLQLRVATIFQDLFRLGVETIDGRTAGLHPLSRQLHLENQPRPF